MMRINCCLYSMTTAVIMSLTYGYEIAESNDKFVANVDEIVERASKAVLPGATLINVFPLRASHLIRYIRR